MDQASTRTALPTGTVTFLFTDIEGSTKLVQRLGADFRPVVEEHHRILRAAIRDAGGIDLRTEGDAFFAVFTTADAAVAAAVAAQREVAAHPWPPGAEVRVRMGMHTGEGVLGGDDYLGLDVHRAARIAAVGHGGQVLVSRTTAALSEPRLGSGVSLRDLGAHRLKDLPDPERLSQVVVAGLPQDFPPLRSLEVASNLPVMASAFIGRHDELNALRERLEGARLVTLTGPGGTGKTRLAVEAARAEQERFPDGVTFVDLSATTEAALVCHEIAAALGLQPSGTDPLWGVLADGLRDRTSLLVLDNFEQVLGAAPEVGGLLAAVPGLSVIATSREPLGIAGEREFPVAPMGADAVALFVERARAIDPDFDAAGPATDTVAEICARLDGLPLAVELAAARVRTLGVEEILERLDRRLPLLTGGPRDAPARQRTLRGAIEWGHDLLEEPERVLFRRLAVFSGGWTIEAAQTVADPDEELGDTLDLMASLVQKNFVRRDRGAGGGRFSMYETIREYALERLAEAGEADDAEARHAGWALAFAEEAGPHLTAEDQGRWSSRLEDEHDNLRAALGWSVRTGPAEAGLRIVTAVWRFWQYRGMLVEGLRWAHDLLAVNPEAPPVVRGNALLATAGMAYWHADYREMERACREALELFRGAGDEAGEAEALYNLGFVEHMSERLGEALELFMQARGIHERLGSREGMGRVDMARGFVASAMKDYELSRELSERALDLLKDGGDRFAYENTLAGLAQSLVMQGDIEAARPRMREVFEMGLRAMNLTQVVIGFHMFALMAMRAGQSERAMRLEGASDGLAERLQMRRPASMMRTYDVPTPSDLSPEEIGRLKAEGRAMSLEDAVAYARSED